MQIAFSLNASPPAHSNIRHVKSQIGTRLLIHRAAVNDKNSNHPSKPRMLRPVTPLPPTPPPLQSLPPPPPSDTPAHASTSARVDTSTHNTQEECRSMLSPGIEHLELKYVEYRHGRLIVPRPQPSMPCLWPFVDALLLQTAGSMILYLQLRYGILRIRQGPVEKPSCRHSHENATITQSRKKYC
jgi:hypothetical protein